MVSTPHSNAQAPTTLVLASNNPGKLIELQALLTPLGLTLIAQSTLQVTEAEEPFCTFVENALAKARHASAATGLPALADDAGLCINAWNGQPGVDTAYYATRFGYEKGEVNNIRVLLEQLQAQGLTQAEQRRGAMVSTLVAVREAKDPEPLIAVGRVAIAIASVARGSGGFGLDPVLELPERGKTFAELSRVDKIRLSHRGLAGQHMQALLVQNWGLNPADTLAPHP